MFQFDILSGKGKNKRSRLTKMMGREGGAYKYDMKVDNQRLKEPKGCDICCPGERDESK